MRRLLLAAAFAFVAAVARAQVDEVVDVIQEINNPPRVVETHAILSSTHSDAVVATPVLGDIIYFNGTGWARLPRGSDGQVLTLASSAPSWAAAGSGGAPTDAHYLTTQAESGLSAESSIGGLTTGLLLNTVSASVGTLSAYGGSSCTNQFVRSLNASGVATCASVSNADIASSTIDLTTKVTGTLPAGNGGTGNAFFAVSGPASSTKTFTFPNASATVLTDNALVTAAQGGTANGFFAVSGPASSTKTFTFPNASSTVLTSNAAVTVAQGGTGITSIAADQVPLATSSNTITATSVSQCTDTGGNHLNYDTSTHTFSCGTTGDGNAFPNVSTTAFAREEFLQPRSSATSTCGTQLGLLVTNTGAGGPGNQTVTTQADYTKHPGVCEWGTGTTAGSGATALTSMNPPNAGDLFVNAETLEWETCVSALSDSTNTYTTRQGFGDVTTGGTPTDGCWFEYTNGTNSGNWVGNCKNNAGPTATNTNVAPTVCPTFQKLKISINTGATAVTFSTDGTASAGGTVGANIPTAAGREFGLMFAIQKTGGSGTTSVGFQLDYIDWNKTISR